MSNTTFFSQFPNLGNQIVRFEIKPKQTDKKGTIYYILNFYIDYNLSYL
jgi:hypothetical protein